MSPLVIPVFISHQGCPHRCVFCDQYTITGKPEAGFPVSTTEVRATVEQWLIHSRRRRKDEVQVAFYGGSFTGLPTARQEELLGTVRPYIDAGKVDTIRISTRPDYIDDTAVALLKKYSVSIVELGIQSLDPDVLMASARGHSVSRSEEAVSLLKEKGFTVGAQIMCGLPGDTTVRLMATVRKVAALGPDFVRIYPTLVIRGSGLEKLYRSGSYRPLSLLQAVALASRMKDILAQHGIRVVRMGLQPSRELENKVVAGPYHPAFGELVVSRDLFRQARRILRQKKKGGIKGFTVAAADQSAFRGPNNVNMKRLNGLGLLDGVEVVFDKRQARNTIMVY